MAGGVFVLLKTSEAKKEEVSARRHVFIKDEATRNFEEYVPPLPEPLRCLLSEARLCDLSCSDGDEPPHTSLMNFSFIEEEKDILVITTRRDTKKFVLMEKHPKISMLLHDFPATKTQRKSKTEFQRTLSVSLVGYARIETGERADYYRNLHLQRNEEYAQFIRGDDKAVITIKIQKARMCNVQDQVTNWESGVYR